MTNVNLDGEEERRLRARGFYRFPIKHRLEWCRVASLTFSLLREELILVIQKEEPATLLTFLLFSKHGSGCKQPN